MLSPTQRVLIEPLRHGHPVPIGKLISILYAARHDGGPDDAGHTIRQQIYKMRNKLAAHGVVIRTVGSGRGSMGFMVDPADHGTLASILESR